MDLQTDVKNKLDGQNRMYVGAKECGEKTYFY